MTLEEVLAESSAAAAAEDQPVDAGWVVQDLFKTRNYGQEPLLVLFVFISLFIGAILREVNKKTRIPFSVLMLYAGILLGKYYS